MVQRTVEVTVLRGTPPDDGDGDGYGDGVGYGYSFGSGSGYGYGSGDGYGDGYGYGVGYGYGDGDGDGYGACDYEYWPLVLESFLSALPSAQRERAGTLRTLGATIAFWCSDASGAACNGGSNKPVAPGTIERVNGPLRSKCGAGQLHATLHPEKWKGERWWIVALIGKVRCDKDKYWALEREVIAECV